MSENTSNLITQFKVQINYRSGKSHVAWFDKFEVTSGGGNIQGLSWKLSKGEENIIFIGINNIESIVQLETRTTVDKAE